MYKYATQAERRDEEDERRQREDAARREEQRRREEEKWQQFEQTWQREEQRQAQHVAVRANVGQRLSIKTAVQHSCIKSRSSALGML